MKITKLKLTNIGPYTGTNNIFEFSSDPFKPITLIGGKNGAGKTTLLKTLKIGLFGSYSYGISTDGTAYLNRVKDLFNYRILSEDNAQFGIEVTMLLNEGLDQNEYEVVRKWDKRGNKFIYTEKVVRNRVVLSSEDVFEFMSKLKELLPPNMIDSILFDGEEIAKIVNDDLIADYLKSLFTTCYNIHLFEKLDSDLLSYSEREASSLATTTNQSKMIEQQKAIDRLKLDIKHMASDLQSLKSDLNKQNESKKALNDQFKNHKGITKTNRDKYEREVKKIEEKRSEATKDLKEYLEHNFVFYNNTELLKDCLREIEKAKPSIYLSYLEQMKKFIPQVDLQDATKALENKKTEEYIAINPAYESMIETLLMKQRNSSKKHYQDKLATMLKSSGEHKKVRDLLQLNEVSDEIQMIYEQIMSIDQTISDLELLIEENEEYYEKMNQMLSKQTDEFNHLERKVMNETNENSSFKIAMDVRKVVQRFIETQTKAKVKLIQMQSKDKFEEVNKKINYVKKIEIDPITFNVSLFDFKDMEMNINILSAGEKQILLASIVWVLFKSSNRDDLFIFDTPLARLDSQNRELYIKNIITTISSQVILLSTDEEFTGSNLELVNSYVGKSYVLNNNPEDMKTIITEGYF